MMPSTLRLKEQPQSLKPRQSFSSQPTSLRPKENQSPQMSEFPFEGENDLEREIERNIARGTSRIGETILGLPGDLYSFGKFLFGAEPETSLPTSSSLRQLSEKATGGYTKPKSESEEKSDEILQDIAGFMLPGAGKYSFARNIGIPMVANLAKEGIKYAGSEKIGEASKLGTMVALDLLAHKGKGAKAYAGELFGKSESLIPEGATLSSQRFKSSLGNLEKSLQSGGSAPSKEKALKKISEINDKMKDGAIEVSELLDFRKSINEIRKELGGFEVQLPRDIKKKAIANLDLVKKEVIGALNEYGDKFNPEFSKLNRSANEAFAAYEQSDKMASFIKKHARLENPAVKSILGIVAGGGALKYPAIASKTAIGVPAAYAAYESYKVLHQVMKSPTLRKFYGNILAGAAAGNASQVSRNAKALEKEFENQ